MNRRVGALLLLLWSGGAWAARAPRVFDQATWAESVHQAGLTTDEVVYPFATTEGMAEWADRRTRGASGPLENLFSLQRALFNTQEFSYKEGATLTAADAFEQRRGNCIALTALFIALSREQGLRTFLVAVHRVVEVSREEDLVVITRHVVAGHAQGTRTYLFDFYRRTNDPVIRYRVVDDLVASSMYHSNLGGSLVRSGDLEGARRQLEIATTLSPDWGDGWVNYGVVLRRLGDVDGAVSAYETALDIDSRNPSALSNLASAYLELGDDLQARQALRAASRRAHGPFALISLADAEMGSGNTEEARRLLLRAKWRYGAWPETEDALARVAVAAGQEDRAERHLQRAARLRERIQAQNALGPVLIYADGTPRPVWETTTIRAE